MSRLRNGLVLVNLALAAVVMTAIVAGGVIFLGHRAGPPASEPFVFPTATPGPSWSSYQYPPLYWECRNAKDSHNDQLWNDLDCAFHFPTM